MDLPSLIRHDQLLIVVGVVLLLNPLYISMLHLDQPNWYRYEASQVTFEDDHVNASFDATSIDSDVACLSHNYRTCLLERYVLQNGGVNYSSQLAAGPGTGYRYAYIDGEFYQVQPQGLGGNGTLSLEHLNREKALRDIATPVERTTPAIRKVVQTGNVTRHHTLPGAGELIREGNTYYVVYKAAYHVSQGRTYDQKKRTGQLIQAGLMIGGFAVGLWLVLRGQRERVLR